MEIGRQIIDIAMDNGATLAGIAKVAAIKTSPSHSIYNQIGDYEGIGAIKDQNTLPRHQLFRWPDSARSVLVIGLSHPENQPELDWWDGKGTPGNRMLIDTVKLTARQIKNNLNVATHSLHYYVEKGGIFLKDAAVLAGFGCIGKNNMLVTPAYGPRIRLRAIFLEHELEPTGPIEFDPCESCKVYCRKVCPENAMGKKVAEFESIDGVSALPAGDGSYDRHICNIRMEKDIAESGENRFSKQAPVKYCRKCELVCPVGKSCDRGKGFPKK